jgi:hypothetical protein
VSDVIEGLFLPVFATKPTFDGSGLDVSIS